MSSTMLGMNMHPHSNHVCMSYSTMIYIVNEFVSGNLAMLLFYIYSVPYMLTTVMASVPLSFGFSCKLTNLSSPLSVHYYVELGLVLFIVYVSMLNLSGLWTVHPDLALTVSHPGLFPLISVAEGSPATVVQELWFSLLLHLRLSMPLSLTGGVILLTNPLWGLMSCCVGDVFLNFPASL